MGKNINQLPDASAIQDSDKFIIQQTTTNKVAASAFKAYSKLTPTSVKTGTYAAQAGDLVRVDATSNDVTINLPATPADKSAIGIKIIAKGPGFKVIINTAGAYKINKSTGDIVTTLVMIGEMLILQSVAADSVWLGTATSFQVADLDHRYASSIPNGIISGLTLSISGLVVTVASGQWRISGDIFTAASPTNITLDAPDDTNSRIDLIYADHTGAISHITGTPAPNPAKPSLPALSIEVGFALVPTTGDPTTGGGTPTGDFALKADLGDINALTTDTKVSAVAAINELQESKLDAGDIGNIAQSTISAINPAGIMSLANDFYFADKIKVTTDGSVISQIIDRISLIVSAQTGGQQPGYSDTGGPNGLPCATFNGSQFLTGSDVLATGAEWTLAVQRYIDPAATTDMTVGVVQNGNNNSNGYGIVDLQGGGVFHDLGGGFFPGVTGAAGTDNFNIKGVWDIDFLVHRAGKTVVYNSLGIPYKSVSSNPVTPTGGHYIGNLNFDGVVPFKGKILRVLNWTAALSQREIQGVAKFLSLVGNVSGPANIISGGDSKMTGEGGSPCVPEDITTTLRTNGKNICMNNKAVVGRTTVDVLTNLEEDVILNYQPSVKNVFVLMVGNNDFSKSIPYATSYANIVAIGAAVRAAGFYFVVGTDIYTYNAASANTNKDNLAGLLRTNHTTIADGFADTLAIPQLTAANMIGGGTYSDDGTHPNAVAAALIAALFEPIVEALL